MVAVDGLRHRGGGRQGGGRGERRIGEPFVPAEQPSTAETA